MIKIETKKIVVRGEQMREVIEISALEEHELPLPYIKSHKPAVFATCWSRRGNADLACNRTKGGIGLGSSILITCGTQVKEEEFQEALEFVRAAGDNLKNINRELAEKNKNWKGQETFLI